MDDFKYNDILNMPRHISETRPHMSNRDRAAQFMPFAALTGFGVMINETSRETSKKHKLSEEELSLLNENLNLIIKNIKNRPEVRVCRFIPDEKKSGGRYENFSGSIRRVDEFKKEVIFTDKTVIPIEDILMIEIAEEQL